jgi:hypothetical protein
MKHIKLFEQYLNELKLYTNYGDYNTEDNIQKLKDMNIKFPTEEEFVDLVKSNFIDSGKISLDDKIDYVLVNNLVKKVEEEIRNKYGKDFRFSFSDHPYGYSKWLNKNCGSNFYLTYDPFMQNKSSYLGCIYMYEVK